HYYDMNDSSLVRLLLGEKIRQIIKGASRVFAGSPYLVDYARTANERVDYLPTVVDLAIYRRARSFALPSRPFTVGWLGSPSTGQYLTSLAPTLARFCKGRDAQVVLVGAGSVELPGVNPERRNWSEARECDDLLSFDVGLMPLTDDPWSRGKCGFKLIQYMA